MESKRIHQFINLVQSQQSIRLQKVKKFWNPMKSIDVLHRSSAIDFVPIVQYLVFNKQSLVTEELEWFEPLSRQELHWLQGNRLAVFKTIEDFYPERFNSRCCLNMIVDEVLVSYDPKIAQRYWSIILRSGNKRRAVLLARAERISSELTPFTEALGICSVVIRGALAHEGRVPDEDLDLIIFVEDERFYDTVKRKLEQLSREASFSSMKWLEVSFESSNFRSSVIYKDRTGRFALDCYVTVGSKELKRLAQQDLLEAIWDCGVLKSAKPLIGSQYFKTFFTDYVSIVARRYSSHHIILEEIAHL